MLRWSCLVLLICLQIVTNACEKKKNLYDMYRSGAMPRHHRNLVYWAYTDDMIEFRKSRIAHGGLTWEDLRSNGFLDRPMLEFVAPGPGDGQVLVCLNLSKKINNMKEVELVDLDGFGAVVNIPVDVLGALRAVTRLIEKGSYHPPDLDYPENEKMLLSVLWSIVDGAEWEPLEKRYHEWGRKYNFRRLW